MMIPSLLIGTHCNFGPGRLSFKWYVSLRHSFWISLHSNLMLWVVICLDMSPADRHRTSFLLVSKNMSRCQKKKIDMKTVNKGSIKNWGNWGHFPDSSICIFYFYEAKYNSFHLTAVVYNCLIASNAEGHLPLLFSSIIINLSFCHLTKGSICILLYYLQVIK